jgi:molybdopterin/thiamine biosynthesis adenylyltransferase
VTRTTLAMSEELWQSLVVALDDEGETAGVVAANVIDDEGGRTILARELTWAPPETYLEREPGRISLRSSGWVPPLRASRGEHAMALFLHTHPGGRAAFSRRDDVVDDSLAEIFFANAGSGLYGSVVIGGTSSTPTISGRVRGIETQFDPVEVVRVVGDALSIQVAEERPRELAVFDRQVRALGRAGQSVLGNLSVGVVGLGGTGSAVTEQLIRLGVKHIVAIDDDEVTASNISRCYGSSTSDLGRAKVDVIADLAERIGSGTVIAAIRGNLRSEIVAKELRHCDVVFSCVDGHGARLILNRFATWHLAPVIDLAVLVSKEDDNLMGVDGRVTWLAPGSACLLCRERIDPSLAYAEQLDPQERRSLIEQGYVPELGEPEPSVVTYTSLVASFATSELLSRLFALGRHDATELLLQISEHQIRANRRPGRVGCFCQERSQWGMGIAEPYLDLTWAR